jgi:hypothetical protein
MMICMDYHGMFMPLHLMIPIRSTLLHLVSSTTFSSSSHFTPWLPHQPRAILQSFAPTLGAYPSHN